MCGLAGFIDFANRRSEGELVAIAGPMAATSRHRGPDDQGAGPRSADQQKNDFLGRGLSAAPLPVGARACAQGRGSENDDQDEKLNRYRVARSKARFFRLAKALLSRYISSASTRLRPTGDLVEDGVGIGGPDEGFKLGIVILDGALDGSLEVDERAKHAAREPAARKPGDAVPTALSHEQEVGVKWKTNRGCRLSQRSPLGCLWVA